jgi:hypothetical protein
VQVSEYRLFIFGDMWRPRRTHRAPFSWGRSQAERRHEDLLRIIHSEITDPQCLYAPNLSNSRALAIMWRIRFQLLNTPSDPRLALVSVKRSSLSLPLTGP